MYINLGKYLYVSFEVQTIFHPYNNYLHFMCGFTCREVICFVKTLAISMGLKPH